MRSDWRVMPFSEAVVVDPRMRPVRGKAYPFISMAAVDPNSQWVEADQQREYGGGGSRFQHGDTLMARITPCLENGKIARYRSTDKSNVAFGSTEFIVIRGRPEITDNRFVYYLTQSAPVRDYAISQMTGTSGRQRVPTSALNHIDVALPPLAEQRRIAHILGTLDDKIELNRRMNATLEGMAQALFKSWFVDFEPVRTKVEGRWRRGESLPGMPAKLYDLFPERLVPSELGEVPEGWEVKTLDQLVALNPREPLKRGTNAPYLNMAAIPTEGCNPDEVILREYTSGTRFRNGDTLLARITPCLENGKTAYVQSLPTDTVAWGSTEFIVMRAIPPVSSVYTYLLARDDAFRAHAIQSMTGTSGRQRVQVQVLLDYRIIAPRSDIWLAFSLLIEPLFARMKKTAKMNQILTAMHNVLLPFLMCSEEGKNVRENALQAID